MRPTISSALVPRSVTVLAVLESVFFGLVARHAYQEGQTAAVYMTLIFVLMPVVLGFRTVATGRDRLGILPISGFLLMLLTAWVAWGPIGPIAVLILAPLFLMLALIGGALASLLRAALRGAALLARAAASLRGPPDGQFAPRIPSPRAVAEGVRPVPHPGDGWPQILIRTPF